MALGWFGNNANPIAVDFGTDSVKVLQTESREGSHRLIAAAGTQIPEDIRANPTKRDEFAAESLRKMICDHGFKGKQVVTCLPAGHMSVQHMRVAKMNNDELCKTLRFEAAGKLPFDAGRAVIKHMIAGEVYEEGQAKTEVIVMAASRESVDRHLAILSKTKLEVVGIHVEPVAIMECFSNQLKKKGDEEVSTMFVDLGGGSTHVVIAHGKTMAFAKHIQIGGDVMTQHAAKATGKQTHEVRQLRMQMAGAAHSHVMLDEATLRKITAALLEPIDALITELELCVRYYESIFQGKGIDRLIFIGGESRNVAICQSIAQRLGLAATLGDPMSRLIRDEKSKSSLDLRQPQPGWAVAVGLSIGLCGN